LWPIPGAPDIENELRRFAYKVEAGAEYAITRPVYDLRLLESFLERIKDHRIPVIASIWPLISLRNAEYMKNDLRLSMPEEIMLRMAQADTPDAARRRASRLPRRCWRRCAPMCRAYRSARLLAFTTWPPR
jgi:5,10-methylenetetrahydrofolate reductase